MPCQQAGICEVYNCSFSVIKKGREKFSYRAHFIHQNILKQGQLLADFDNLIFEGTCWSCNLNNVALLLAKNCHA